jgi:mRNA interferase RelE/StbE
MSYSLEFLAPALREWKKFNSTVREQFKNKLTEHLENPRVPAAQLRGSADRYKIKLRDVGYRLVYSVDDKTVVVTVIAVVGRDRNAVYKSAGTR